MAIAPATRPAPGAGPQTAAARLPAVTVPARRDPVARFAGLFLALGSVGLVSTLAFFQAFWRLFF